MEKPCLIESGVQLAGLDGFDGGYGLHAPCSSQAVADHALGRIHLDLAGVAEHGSQGLDLCNVAHQRTGRMRIDVVDLHAISTKAHKVAFFVPMLILPE